MSEKKVFAEAEKKMHQTIEAMRRDFLAIRTSRASSTLVEEISVECYNTTMPLKQVASISIPDARHILIQPWDKTVLPDIEKAILKSGLGLTPNNDGKNIRLGLPPLSEERRKDLAKLIEKIAEEGKVSIRTTRRAANANLEQLEKDKLLSEDDRFKAQDKIQKMTKDGTKKLDEMVAAKEAEIMEV
ncbi:MAG: ribosome recycling factor [Candidatus Ratteibacteria bacterium]|nr:ribosome recycling factor [Candidatus Ratteibacteria bacterium]